MAKRRQVTLAFLGAVGFFLGVQLGALALVGPFEAAGYQAVENPQDPVNSVLYIGILLVATAGMLVLFRYGRTAFLRAFILVTSGIISAYVFSVFVPPILGDIGGSFHPAALLGGLLVIAGLYAYPEWWVIDTAGLLMGMGAAALFGISLDVLPVLILLVILAVYDAISVYGTEHMLTLATGVMELRVPVLVIIPTTKAYSFIDMAGEIASEVNSEDGGPSPEETPDSPEAAEIPAEESREAAAADEETETAEPFERDAFFIGLGDAVIPTILVASAAAFLETPTVLGIESAALGGMIGTLVGLLALLWMVLNGRAHAGLPLLNSGVITGYLIGALAGGVPLIQAIGLGPYF